ncbi:HD domain-containing protein [Luteipulveratus sp. YIM 133132]|uniref:HD-GYP domain-containing protein n=1 Tax=Luteipulveratus flavus TaxID=3031728 RepID=UPI0023AF11EF|nr:HD domain-containing phosphohydrolase [Luteipulveratus sp. YIM 133132]MDE9365886.1 HD domain-containing protein [Luteipulveratus sp. YIM 133132]
MTKESGRRIVAGPFAVLIVVAILVAAVLHLGRDDLAATDFTVIVALTAVMYFGEILRLRGLGPRGLSPLAVAGAIGLCFSYQATERNLVYGADVVIVAASASLLVGISTLWLRWRSTIDVAAYAVRIIAISLAAILFRSISLDGDRTLLQCAQDTRFPRWRVALFMILVAIGAHAVELALQVLLRRAREGRPIGVIMREDLREMVPPTLAAVSTGVVLALGIRSLNLLAIPLFVLPLVLMRYAMQRQERINQSRRQAIAALSKMTDLAGYTRADHAARVAQLCGRVGLQLGLADSEMADLETAALMHDIGQVSLGEPIPGGATVDAAPRDQQRIADEGAEIVKRTGSPERVVSIVQQQAVPFRRLVEEGERLSLSARILKVCNAYDDFSGGDPSRRDAALLRLRLGLGYEYDPEVVQVLAQVTADSSELTPARSGAGSGVPA